MPTVRANKQHPLPPVKATRAQPPRKQLRRAPSAGALQPATKAVKPPTLARRSSSVSRIVTNMVNQVEVRFRNLREAFRAADRDCDGYLSRDELQTALFLWRVQAQGRHVDDIMASFDRDGDEGISYSEFCEGLKPFSVHDHPVFGLGDKYVTERHRVLPTGNQVIFNDNLVPFCPPPGGSVRRPDYQLYELPRAGSPGSPKSISDATNLLSDRIHDKYKNLRDAFRQFDENKDGKLSQQELLYAVHCFNLPIPREHVLKILKLCDTDADGLINYAEFASVLKRKDALGH